MTFIRGPIGQKAPSAVSDKIRRSAQGEHCTLMLDCCDGGGATTVFAHLRAPGDGINRKPPDYAGVYACAPCHDAVDDRGGKGWLCGDADKLRAWRKTMDILWAKGLITFGGKSNG